LRLDFPTGCVFRDISSRSSILFNRNERAGGKLRISEVQGADYKGEGETRAEAVRGKPSATAVILGITVGYGGPEWRGIFMV
jgi:hypothetical protein